MQEIVANLQVSCATVQGAALGPVTQVIAGPGTPGGLPSLGSQVPRALFKVFFYPHGKVVSKGKEIRLRLVGSPPGTKHCNFSPARAPSGMSGIPVAHPWEGAGTGSCREGVSMVLEFGVLPTGGASGKQPDGGGCIYWLAASGQLCCQQTICSPGPPRRSTGFW